MSDNRDAYVEKMKAKLDEWNAEIDKLEAKARQAEADARIGYHKQIDTLKEKRTNLSKRFDDLRQSGESAWKDMKSGVELAANSLSEALRSAQSRFK